MADKYIIRVTAGSNYNADEHVVVPVNSHQTVNISNDLIDAEINVRVKNYSGLPRNSPRTSPYFCLEPHASNDDQYSIAIRFRLKRPEKLKRKVPKSSNVRWGLGASSLDDNLSSRADENDNVTDEGHVSSTPENGISGHDLQFGNDFDHPIRDRLPPGFSYAMNIVKWWIDPGLDGDPYADTPYLYGPGLSSFNIIHLGTGRHVPEKGGLYFEEGGNEEGLTARRAMGAPDGAKKRMKWALQDASKSSWVFEYDRTYCVDFFNPYIDFSSLALRLPGYALPIMKYWDGQGLREPRKRSHALRYVLRNRATGDTYLVVLFTLYLNEDVNKDGSLKSALKSTRVDTKGLADPSDGITVSGAGEDGVEVVSGEGDVD
ncbi:hypothetical protein GGS21DRAFT_440247 [Xylaria nigripes]|nr:hypothetical protein GGS21DRAFT_440247 [Xylaria nigripes]